jgi:hypothetical protein
MANDNELQGKSEDPELVIGEFTIKRWSDHSIFIRRANGVGCEFPVPLFEGVVRMFYNVHFDR